MVRMLNMFGMGRLMAAAALWGVCLICVAWAALWLRSAYGRVLDMFGMGRPSCGLPMGVSLICLAWAALWLRSPYGRVLNMFGMGRPMAAVSL